MLNAFIVEDDYISSLVLKRLLQKMSIITNVMHAGTYNDAVSGILCNRPQIIFMDINLGDSEFCGIDVVNNIVCHDYKPYIVYTTAYSDEHIKKCAMNTNPFSYLNKPLESYQINDVVLHIQNDYNKTYLSNNHSKVDTPSILY